MCRSKSEGDRRCSCDSSEARRIRRVNAQARRLYSKFVAKVLQPNFLSTSKLLTPFTPEQVKSIVRGEINDIELLRKNLEYETDSKVLAHGALKYDRILNSIGNGVEFIAEEECLAPKDEALLVISREIEDGYEVFLKEGLQRGLSRDEAESVAEDRTFTELIQGELGSTLALLLMQRNTAMRQALLEVGVEFADPETLEYAPHSEELAITSLKSALHYFPQTWVNLSNRMHQERPLVIKLSTGRAGYKSKVSELEDFSKINVYSEIVINHDPDYIIGNDAGLSPALHEFAHRIEHAVDGVAEAEEVFLLRRAGHLPAIEGGKTFPEAPSLIYPDPPKGKEEYGYKDNFPAHYMGRLYSEGPAKEILSTGMEALFAGRYGGFSGLLRYNPDPEYKRFVLGILAVSSLDKG